MQLGKTIYSVNDQNSKVMVGNQGTEDLTVQSRHNDSLKKIEGYLHPPKSPIQA